MDTAERDYRRSVPGESDPPRWNEPEKNLLMAYLKDGRLDISRIDSSSYLAQLKKNEVLWDRHPNKNFYQNVRRTLLSWGITDSHKEVEEETEGCEECLCRDSCRCKEKCGST
jgi:hypothetical protein